MGLTGSTFVSPLLVEIYIQIANCSKNVLVPMNNLVYAWLPVIHFLSTVRNSAVLWGYQLQL